MLSHCKKKFVKNEKEVGGILVISNATTIISNLSSSWIFSTCVDTTIFYFKNGIILYIEFSDLFLFPWFTSILHANTENNWEIMNWARCCHFPSKPNNNRLRKENLTQGRKSQESVFKISVTLWVFSSVPWTGPEFHLLIRRKQVLSEQYMESIKKKAQKVVTTVPSAATKRLSLCNRLRTNVRLPSF